MKEVNINITGADIIFTIPFLNIPITSTIVNTWIVIAVITAFCIWLTRNMKIRADSRRQYVAELIVTNVTGWVSNNMGTQYAKTAFPSFIAALFSLSALSSLIGLIGFYPPTADLATTLGWSVVVFVMTTSTNIKTNKLSGYLKGFTEPVLPLTPLNIIGELSTPVSMAFRHFGNIASGQVVSALIYASLMQLNRVIFNWIPGALGGILGEIPFTQIGLPAVLSIYFDVFTSLMQAFIFCMLTMSYISAAAETD